MIFIRLVPAVIGKQTVRQNVGSPVLNHAGATSAVIDAGGVRARTFFNIFALHILPRIQYAFSLFAAHLVLHFVSRKKLKNSFSFSQLIE